MYRPKAVSQNSIMPAYTWFQEDDLNTSLTKDKISAMRKIGVPYKKGYEAIALKDLHTQAHIIAEDIVVTMMSKMPKSILKDFNKEAKIKELEKKEIVALIAYLQRLGTDIKVKPTSN
jgi:cytochrome c oxidase cbb3-type subunit I/II